MTRISLPQNDRRTTELHPDFTGRFELGGKQWSAAAWMSRTKKGDPYLSLQLTCDDTSKRLKFAIWKAAHEIPEDPHFESTQEAEGRAYQLQAWVLPASNGWHRLELTIDATPTTGNHNGTSSALETSKKRIADFLAESGEAILPPNSAPAPTSAPVAKAVKDEDEDLDEIPY
jgi:hypothetical protein